MIVAALRKLEGRTDFKGQSQIGNREESDPMFSPAGNFFHYQGQQKEVVPTPDPSTAATRGLLTDGRRT